MNSAIGFTISLSCTGAPMAAAAEALKRLLAHFPDLRQHTVQSGDTTLTVWGRGKLEDSLHRLPDGSLLALVGGPTNLGSWDEVEQGLLHTPKLIDYCIPWEGRVVLLHISPDGCDWTLWNDWVGSIPVYYTRQPHWRMASTLEPVITAAGGFTKDDFFWPGVIATMLHGHGLSNWTIFKDMHTVSPDSVTVWQAGGMQTKDCGSITPDQSNWETSGENLIEHLHDVVSRAILSALKDDQHWILPLSSGLDSRLIAAVGAKAGIDMHAYTWGPPNTQDVVFARQIAKAAGLPWKRVDLGDSYLIDLLPVWIDLFGSATHFHGMYQMSFLNAIRSEPAGRVVSGYLGESLAGRVTVFGDNRPARWQTVLPDGFLIWRPATLQSLFKFDVDAVLAQIMDEIETQKANLSGASFHAANLLNIKNRQPRFTTFQTVITEYWRGNAAPYINREYAQFCFSLPRYALEDRRLMIEMMRRYFPRVMSIPGTFSREPAILTGSYLLKRRAARMLPPALVKRLLPEFTAEHYLSSDADSLRKHGEKTFWPFAENRQILSEWMNLDVIEHACEKAMKGDKKSLRQMQAIQAITYRAMGSPQPER